MSGDEISYSDISENVEPLFSNPSKEWFANLPQPAARPRKWPITDPYLRACVFMFFCFFLFFFFP
jgi:hypothetical protein